MNKNVVLLLSVLAILIGCQYEEPYHEESPYGFDVTLEDIHLDPETRTYADDQHLVLWHNDDRVSVFEKKEYWEEYTYTGRTGTTGGWLNKITSEGSGTGGDLDYYYAVYPHSELNGFNNQGHLLLTLPHEQPYDEFSFGRGSNLMVSASEDNNFAFKNIGGYLVFKLYGEGVSVASIRLTGNNDEEITGDIDVVVSPGIDPVTTMSTARYAVKYDNAVLVCDPPVELGATASDYKEFWFVLPPMSFEGGFSIEVTTSDGDVWTKTTSRSWTITRNHYSPVSAMEVVIEQPQPNNIIYYTSSDGNIVKPTTSDYYIGASNSIDVFGANIVSNDYIDGQGVITFDGNVTLIGKGAFNQSFAKNLETITIPQSVITIAPGAFTVIENSHLNRFYGKFSSEDGRCLIEDGRVMAFAPYGLTEYTLPDGISIIGSHSIESKELNSIVIPEGVKTIEDQAFYWSYNIETAILPQSLEYIGDKSIPFAYYSIPSGVKHIGVLSGPALVDLNSTVPPEIADGAFVGSYWIYVPKGTAETYKNEWPEYAERIREKSEQPLNEIWYTTNDGGPVTTTHNPYFTTWWKQKILSNDNGKIVFNAPVTIVGDCFEQSNLVSISFPDAADFYDGQGIFLDCPYLKKVSFGKYCQLIPFMCFNECDALEEVVIPDSVKKIGDRAFYRCTGLTHITIPNSVTSICGQAFIGCTGLTSITIPSSVTSIGSSAFSGCTGLVSITIPNSITSIASYTFSGCTGLTHITIPNSVTSIGGDAFSRCTGLTHITIPNSVTSIGSSAFSGCTGLVSIIIPNSITSIERSILSDCTGLTSITIPDGVTTIGDYAFSGCTGLTAITIPSSVTSIKSSAFSGCNCITSYTVLSSNPPTLDSVLGGSLDGFIIYVPAASVEAYKSASYWSYLSRQIQAIPE